MSTVTIKGTIAQAKAPRELPSGKYVQEFLLIESTGNKEHPHPIQVWSNSEPHDDVREFEGQQATCVCYVNSHKYMSPTKGESYSTQLRLKSISQN